MAMVIMARTAGLAAALCLITAAPANAAFYPDLRVGVTPATPAATPMLTATISQPATDTPIERFTLTLPAGFSAPGAPGAVPCPLPVLRTGACPPTTRIGFFAVRLAASAPVTGTIHKTGANTFGLLVSVLGGAVTQAVEGSVVRRTNGALDMKLDQLPALPVTALALRFFGGKYSLVRTPAQCGRYTVDGKFTSRRDELAIDRSAMAIACAPVATVSAANLRMSDRRFKAGSYGTGTVFAWSLSRAVDHSDVKIERRVDGAWRSVGRLVATADAGENHVRWDGRLRGHKLKPGIYAARIQPAGGEATGRIRFRIVR